MNVLNVVERNTIYTIPKIGKEKPFSLRKKIPEIEIKT